MAKKNEPTPPPKKKTCPNCMGSGIWIEPHPSGDPNKSKTMTCPWCKGAGER
jgi:DnaJ-class molecular chaperone